VEEIGETANSYANLAGRTEINAVDIKNALTDIGKNLFILHMYSL
jgi:histone H3/H4